MAKFNIPNNTHRTAIMGRTGSGKTQAGAWLLSLQNWTRQPWVIVDTKNDVTILNDIEAEELDLSDKVPKHPGLYIIHPLPHELDKTEEFLWKVWAKERTGIFVDEGYMLPNSGPQGRGAFQALLTQGRSKKIPMIVLTQRPAWMSRFLWSEADFHNIFALQSQTDIRNVRDFVPANFEKSLPQYWSRWSDVGRGSVDILKPVPDRATLMQTFRDRQQTIRKPGRWATRFISLGR